MFLNNMWLYTISNGCFKQAVCFQSGFKVSAICLNSLFSVFKTNLHSLNKLEKGKIAQ